MSNGFTPQDDETRQMFNDACARLIEPRPKPTEVEIQLPLTWDWTDDGGAELKDANGEEILPKTIVAALNATSAVGELIDKMEVLVNKSISGMSLAFGCNNLSDDKWEEWNLALTEYGAALANVKEKK